MKMRKLGHSGLFVSELPFGAMTFGGSDGIWGKVGRLGQAEADALVGAAPPDLDGGQRQLARRIQLRDQGSRSRSAMIPD